MHLTMDGGTVGIVTARTFRRDHFLVRVRVSDDSLEVAVHGEEVPEVGDEVRLAVDEHRIVRFD
jgi:hypothetical protein